MVKKYIVLLLLTSSCYAENAFVKKVEKKKSCNQLKQESLEELEAVLTQTIDMIASLGELQKEIIQKMREIVVAPSDSFFAKAKPSELAKYHANVLTVKTEVGKVGYTLQHEWINDITHNFQRG